MKQNCNIDKIVAYYTKKFNTRDPELIARELGIKIVIKPLGDILGHYIYAKRFKWIFINEDIIGNETLVKIVMAHELGHAILHSNQKCYFIAHRTLMLVAKFERQANIFAAHLLIDDEMLKSYAGYTEEQFCNCTGYPKELVGLRIGYQK